MGGRDANSILRKLGPEGLRAAVDSAGERLAGPSHRAAPDATEFESIAGPDRPRLEILVASDLAEIDVPSRHWIVPAHVPDQTITLLGGDGGTGKSLLALQLGVAMATSSEWLGLKPAPGAVLLFSAEDDRAELHRRLADICGHVGCQLAELGAMHLISVAGTDALLATADRRTGAVTPTPLWNELRAAIVKIAPKMVIIDTAADVFGGDENNRAQVRAFVGLLRGLAIECDLAVLMLSHPSLSGMASGSGSSGSTAWSNSVRSRLYLERPKSEDGNEPDPLLRILTVKKSNYAATGAELRLRWAGGVFRREGGASGLHQLQADQLADAAFLDLLALFEAQGREISTHPSPSYAPAVFAKHPNAKGFTRRALAGAMERLLAANRIAVITTGPASRRKSKIVTAASNQKDTAGL